MFESRLPDMFYGEKKRAYQRTWIAQRRKQWIDDNGPCVSCGSNIDLEVDHINPDTKTLAPSRLWSLSISNPIRIEELAKCQVLCSVCHKAKTKAHIEVTAHGEVMYRKGCRCDICRTAGTISRRKYKRGNH